MSDTVTCRVCGDAMAPREDAVLLCGACRAEPDTTIAMVWSVYNGAIDAGTVLLERASVETTRRVLAVSAAAVACKGDPAARLKFERRYQASLAVGDELSAVLQAFERCRTARQWRDRALAEVETLRDEVLL